MRGDTTVVNEPNESLPHLPWCWAVRLDDDELGMAMGGRAESRAEALAAAAAVEG